MGKNVVSKGCGFAESTGSSLSAAWTEAIAIAVAGATAPDGSRNAFCVADIRAAVPVFASAFASAQSQVTSEMIYSHMGTFSLIFDFCSDGSCVLSRCALVPRAQSLPLPSKIQLLDPLPRPQERFLQLPQPPIVEVSETSHLNWEGKQNIDITQKNLGYISEKMVSSRSIRLGSSGNLGMCPVFEWLSTIAYWFLYEQRMHKVRAKEREELLVHPLLALRLRGKVVFLFLLVKVQALQLVALGGLAKHNSILHVLEQLQNVALKRSILACVLGKWFQYQSKWYTNYYFYAVFQACHLWCTITYISLWTCCTVCPILNLCMFSGVLKGHSLWILIPTHFRRSFPMGAMPARVRPALSWSSWKWYMKTLNGLSNLIQRISVLHHQSV